MPRKAKPSRKADKPERRLTRAILTSGNPKTLLAKFCIQQEIDMTLRDQGFRFVKRGTDFKWVHPAEFQATDTDCTDMNDDEFSELVASQQ